MSLSSLSTVPASLAPRSSAPLGATPRPGGVYFSLFASRATSCAVRLFSDDGAVIDNLPLQALPGGIFAADVPSAGAGTLYKFVLDGRELPDPYARWLPQGVHGPAAVTQTPTLFPFAHAGAARPLREHVIYELHVGTFTKEGTYTAARKRLPYLVELGVTTIELMPLASFDGQRGWGYDGVALYAPFPPYGTPDELRAFVDEAHGLGLGVLLDVVYNHFGPSGNYLAAYCPDYFTKDIQNAWGDSPNFAHPVLRRMVIDNALYWLTEFRFDGLRLDAIHAITDPSPRHILRELVDEVRRANPAALLMGEDERNDPTVIDELGLDAVWADDFHHVVRVTLTGENDGYYAAYPRDVPTIAETIEAGWLYRGQTYPTTGKPRGKDAKHLEAPAFVYCIQNHDQVGNRAHGDRLSDVVPLDAYCAASALLLFLPMTPLLFMGQEWGATTPFQFFTDHEPELGRLISEGRRREFQAFEAVAHAVVPLPDPQNSATFNRSKLDWEELVAQEHQRVHFLYRCLLRLRREDPVLSSAGRSGLSARGEGSLLQVVRKSEAGERLLLVNFSSAPLPLGPLQSQLGGRSLLLATCDVPDAPTELPAYGAIIFS